MKGTAQEKSDGVIKIEKKNEKKKKTLTQKSHI